MSRQSHSLLVLLLALLLALPLAAQENSPAPTRDPRALAQRFLRLSEDAFALAPITPQYEVGDTATFWMGKANSDTPTRITAELGAVTPNVYLWVEQGITYDRRALAEAAGAVQQLQAALRQRDRFGLPAVPGIENVVLPASLNDIPDVDTDPHLFIVYTRDLGSTQYTINTNDSLPEALIPGGYTNQHELIALNTAMLPDTALDAPPYIGLITRALYDLVSIHNTPRQAGWLRESLGWYMLLQLQQAAVPEAFVRAYLQSPATPLRAPALAGANPAALGSQQLFLNYLQQRFGGELIRALFTSPGDSMSAINRWLAQNNYTDPITRERITAADVFADFTAANILNAPIGDGRYLHTRNTLPTDQGPAGMVARDTFTLNAPGQLVGQYGAANFYLFSEQGGEFTLRFNGQSTTPRLPLDERDPDDRFYWTGRAADQHATMTRAFDLRRVERATLEFDTWYDLAADWNYVYITASADDGATWDILPLENVPFSNHLGVAYGAGMTGVSSLEGAQPFPYLGILFASDGMTVSDIVPDAPADQAGFEVGDVIIGYDEREWPGAPDIIGLLSNYRPGDTLSLYVQRGTERVSLPVILAPHPERVFLPQPEWQTYRADLSRYAGREIILRFEYISLPGHENPGLVLDNIAIPQLGYLDDAEDDPDWTLAGWQQTDNRARQNFLLQVISTGGQSSPARVRQLITPRDEATSGTWHFTAQPNEVLAFIVAGLTDDTDEPARFDLSIAPPGGDA